MFGTMDQISDHLPPDHSFFILCHYTNETKKIQVARITSIANWYFERVVFPGQRLTFEAPPEAILEIHSGMMASAVLEKTISCKSLQAESEIKVGSEFVDNPATELTNSTNADELLVLKIDVSSNASTDEVAPELANLCKAISAYHIACGGTGLAIDDWEILVLARQLVGV